MKRLVVLCVCLLLASAVPASADIMGTVTEGNLTVGVTFNNSPLGTALSSNYNIVDVWLETLVGPAAGSEMNAMGGTWAAVGGTMKVYAGAATTTTFKKDTLLVNTVGGTVYSGINLDNYVGTFTRDGGVTNQSSTLYADAWYCSGGDATSEIYPGGSANAATNDNGFPASLIGEFLVTKSTTAVTFTGLGGAMDNGFSYDYGGGTVEPTAFSCPLTVVPEPSTIALLGCGLFGLLAYAWRKRK
ncbi:MAG: PEP-CTERM sorting domain-containing protein [Thermoguttaceae bacterium]